jgi:UDP-glucose 4-epimerase
MGEHLLENSGMPFTVLRPAVTYGIGVKGNIKRLATLARTPLPLPFANLSNRRSLLAREALASAIELVLTSGRAEGEVFLVADTEPISVADMLAAIREGLGRRPRLVHIPNEVLRRLTTLLGSRAEWARLSGNLVIDASKLRSIGWTSRTSSYEGIIKMMRSESSLGSGRRSIAPGAWSSLFG